MKHYKSVFNNEQELLNALLQIHCEGNDIECDPMYFKGNFYKNGVNKPKYKFDIKPVVPECEEGNAANLPLKDNSLNYMILDPPFLFEKRNRPTNFYSALTHTIFNGFDELESCYKGILKEAYRILKKNGVLIFKCQDYTDSKTTMTHCFVYNWATESGFYTKDLAILVLPNKVYNGNTKQRHLRKIHTYFYVFIKKGGKYDKQQTSIKRMA